MLSTGQIAEFQRDGYLNAGDLLGEKEQAELARELDRIIAKGPQGFAAGEPQPVLFRDLAAASSYQAGGTHAVSAKPVWQIVNIWEASRAFERLIYHPAIVSAICQLTGFGDLQVWHDQVQYKPAEHGGATTWHQDAPAWPSIEPMTPVSAWIPFDDAQIDNGCMWMVPGSHLWGPQQQVLRKYQQLKTLPQFAQLEPFAARAGEPPQPITAVPRPVKRGQVHFHHSLTWHGSPQNASPRPRRAIAIHYMTSEARFTGRDHPMRQFIQVGVGQPMLQAGPHFPIVCRHGTPVRKG